MGAGGKLINVITSGHSCKYNLLFSDVIILGHSSQKSGCKSSQYHSPTSQEASYLFHVAADDVESFKTFFSVAYKNKFCTNRPF